MKLEPVKFSSTHHTLHCNPQLRERLKCACVTFNLILTATHSDILTVPKLLLSFFFPTHEVPEASTISCFSQLQGLQLGKHFTRRLEQVWLEG